MTVELIPVVTVGTPARKLKRQLEIIGIHTKFCRLPEHSFHWLHQYVIWVILWNLVILKWASEVKIIAFGGRGWGYT